MDDITELYTSIRSMLDACELIYGKIEDEIPKVTPVNWCEAIKKMELKNSMFKS